jgi:hypothetical protein
MPNWCLNKIKITGINKNLRRVSKKIKNICKQDDNEIGLMESLVGREPTISDEDYFNGGWYDSNMDYWGTKWDVSKNDFVFEATDDCINLEIETAWSPPLEFCKLLSKKYGVIIKLKYYEPGIGFCGKFEIDNEGEILSYNDYQNLLEGLYNFDNTMFWEEIEDIIEYNIIDIVESGEDFIVDKEKTYINNFENFITLEDLKKIEKIINDKKKIVSK